jgi:hypothetical protein
MFGLPGDDMTTNARVLEQIAEILGPEAFNRLVASTPATRDKGRLRFWQEELLEKVASQTNLHICGVEEFLNLFDGAELREVPQQPWTREVFLREIAGFPLGGFPLDETPPEWMAEAWGIDSVREAISDDLARDVSKTGSLCCTNEYLSFLERSLSGNRLVDLFLHLRERCGSRESEFRPEFERAFPKCADALPPRCRENQLWTS